MQAATAVPAVAEAAALAELASDFPGWHIWRSRDSRGRDHDWNATRRKMPRPASEGIVRRVTAPDADRLHGLLERQRATETATAAQAA